MLVLASPKFPKPWASLLSLGFARPKPDVDLSNRHPAFRYFPVREDLVVC